jgi:hypothetical protein
MIDFAEAKNKKARSISHESGIRKNEKPKVNSLFRNLMSEQD